jgi:hypothetical protein
VIPALAIGAVLCAVLAFFFALGALGWWRYRKLSRGPVAVAEAMGLREAGWAQGQPAYWWTGTDAGRPIGATITFIQDRQGVHRGRSAQRRVLRVVAGCRTGARLDVQPGTDPSTRVLRAENADAVPLLKVLGADGFGAGPRDGLDGTARPSPDFALDYPSLCWVDHLDTDVGAEAAPGRLAALRSFVDLLERP